ncbi:DNA (cytosine-5)-methyltransferase 3A [Camponotus floridanus]|uniref:DNA (cytosine-5-)-methyltransferase n=1 Tax=Camponotus floridanus TaxID=104421 RepID=E1ZVF2_CAMFO|nr:DNA (cytosine-5)-methyltransferase 3A [Camponotus floridanus]
MKDNLFCVTVDDLIFYPYPKNIQERLDTLREKNIKATERFISNQRSSPETSPTKKQAVEKCKDTNTSWKQIEDERLPLQNQNPGVIAWAKIAGHCWWPAMIIDYRDCCLKEPSFGCQWIMWYGDYKVSEVRHLEFLKFYKGLEKMRDYIQNTVKQCYLDGVLQASKDYCSRLGCSTDNWTLDNVFEYFSNMNNIHVPYNQLQVSDSNKIYDKYSDEIVKKINEFKSKPNVDAERKNDIKTSDALHRVISGECTVEKLCLKCLRFSKDKMEEHPFFIGSLCKECSYAFKPCMFVHGNDGKCFYCTVCAATGTVLICDTDDCPRVYCTACLKFLICPKAYDDMLSEDPWKCFLCRDESKQPANMLLHPRLDWKEKVSTMFRTASNPASKDINFENYKNQKKPIRVLSLFDGLSTGFLVLLNLGIVVDVYYASEIDKNALTISSAHFGDRITYLGDVRDITKEKIQEIAPIDLLIGGSPCNDLSLVNPARLGLHDPKGTGILFFEYCRIKKLMKKANKDRHLFWLYENVASMPSEYRLEINKHLGREPDVIDAADFSPQHRLRLYWHNFPFNPYMPLFQNQQDVQDKLTPNLNRKALCKKLRTVTCRTGSLLQGKAEVKPIMMKGESDRLWITELEEIFGFPRHFTDVKNLSATNRQKLLGKSWSVQTLTAILRPLCFYFKCKEDETSNNISALHKDISLLYRGKQF